MKTIFLKAGGSPRKPESVRHWGRMPVRCTMATRLGKLGEHAKATGVLGGASILAIISCQPAWAQACLTAGTCLSVTGSVTESDKNYAGDSNNSPAIKVNNGGNYQGSNITLNTAIPVGSTGGFALWVVTGGTATLTDSTITTGTGSAQQSQWAVYAQNPGSIVTLIGGTVSTYDTGVNNHGLYALNGGQITSSANITIAGGSASSYGAYANNGTIYITGNGVTIDTSGGSSGTSGSALYANGTTAQITTVVGSTVALKSLGTGVTASGGGQITLNSGTTITALGTGTTSHGILANGNGSMVTSFADSVTVNGGGSWGVNASNSGIVYLNAGTITNNGTGAGGGGLAAQGGGQIIANGSAAGNTSITVTTGGTGAYVTSGGTISLTDSIVTAGGNGLSALYNATAAAGGTINFTGGRVTSTGVAANASGANTTIKVYGATLTATGANAAGANAAAGGYISLDSATEISSVGSGTNATLSATGTTSPTVTYSQIVSAADVNTSTSAAAIAAYAGTNGIILLNGGTLFATTAGLQANTGGTITADASVLGNTAITVNSGGIGVNANGGNVKLVGSTINATTVGLQSSVAAGTPGSIMATDATVTTTATNGFGLYANGANTQITVNGGSITTNGAAAHGLEVNGGTITVGADGSSNTTVVARGAGADAIYGTAAGGTVTITNGNLSSDQADAVGVVAGALTPIFVNVSATTLSGAGNLVSGTGVANITASNASQLTGAAASANSNVTLQSGSVWHLSAPVGAATASTLGSLTMDRAI